jgi:hypothetical protein
MTVSLVQLQTTELSSPCLHAAYLKGQGFVSKDMAQALYVGQLWHQAARIVHEQARWDADEAGSIVIEAMPLVRQAAIAEGREPTEVLIRDEDEYAAQVAEWLGQYQLRFAERFKRYELIGCEVPVRWSTLVDDEIAHFASHIDLLFRDDSGQPVVWDWKTVDKPVTRAYLSRNIQLGMYAIACEFGKVMIGGHWEQMRQQAAIYWVHIRNLNVFKKATTAVTDSGEAVQYKKGDTRPENSILRECLYVTPKCFVDEFATRVRMKRLNLHPRSPDPTGCHLCESAHACRHGEENNIE